MEAAYFSIEYSLRILRHNLDSAYYFWRIRLSMSY